MKDFLLKDFGKRKTLITVLILAVIVIGIIAVAVVYYNTQFSLALKGEKEMTVGLNSVYREPGVEAVAKGKDASDDVEVKGKVDTSTPGTYRLVYRLKTLKMERSVTVLDEMNPKIVLEDGDVQQTVRLGEEYQDPGYSAFDEKGGDITDRVKVVGDDFQKAGKNEIVYTVSDDEGNTTRVTREVTVEANTDYDSPGLPICMYHYVYDEENPPDDLNQRYGNYISMQDLEEELEWLNEEWSYSPTWQEVRDYGDG